MSQVPPTPSEKVYVCFLPPNITEQEIRAMFGSFGLIKLLQLSKRNDGFTFAYITYETIKQAEDAIIVMNKMKILDKILKVSFAATYCISKRKKLKEIREKLKQAKVASESNKPSDGDVKIGNPGIQKSKRQIKREKQMQKVKEKEMKVLQSEDSQLKYLEKVEETLKNILEVKKQLIFTMKEKQEQKLKESSKQKEQKEPVEGAENEQKKQSKVSIADLNVFRSWLKERDETKQLDEADETEWDEATDSIDLTCLGQNKYL